VTTAVTSGFDEDPIDEEISDGFVDIDDDDVLQELGFDTARPARSFRRTGTLAQALEGTGDMFVDIDDPLENGPLDFEDDLLDTDDEVSQHWYSFSSR
jgi:hypothetical protein